MPAQHLTLAQTEPGKALHSERVLRAGHLIRAQEAFVLAETGRAWARVYRRPRVAVLAVGSRLAPLCSELGPRMLYHSNPCFLCALCAEIGIPATNAGIIPYEHDHLEQCLEENLTDHDVAIVCGGFGLGNNDLLPSVLRTIRFESHFCGLAMNHGNHNLFATRASKVVFGLPRNPLGLLASFVLLVRDGLRRMMGFQEPVPDILIAHLRKEASNPSDVCSYLLAKLYRVGGRWEVLPIVCENVSDAFALTKADALIALPPRSSWPRGACTQVIRLKE